MAAGSIAGYDIVLSVAEDAINRQFRLLYNTEIDPRKLPAVSAVPGGGKTAQARHLINHDLTIHMNDNNNEYDPWTGLEAHIEPPTVSFTQLWTPSEMQSSNKKPNDYRTTRITFKFKRGDLPFPPNQKPKSENEDVVSLSGDIDPQDSVYQFFRGTGRKAKEDHKVINGWSMSWQVRLARTDIADVQGGLIGPAKDKNRPEIVPKSVQAQIENYAKAFDNRKFLVSSIWCLFTAAEMVDSFCIQDADGKEMQLDPAFSNFITIVSSYFNALKPKSDGLALPDKPFVLGYGLSQQLPAIEDLAKAQLDKEREAGRDTKFQPPPPYFQPRTFHFTTTPGTATVGTLNFCILTHREVVGGVEAPGRQTDPSKDLNAGILGANLFDRIKSTAAQKDAIFGFSKDLFMDRYIGTYLAPKLFIDPGEMLKTFLDFWKDKPLGKRPRAGFVKYDDVVTQSSLQYKRRVNFATCGSGHDINWAETSMEAKFANGFSELEINVSSDLSKLNGVRPGSTMKRRVYIDAKITCEVELTQANKQVTMNGISSLIEKVLSLKSPPESHLESGEVKPWERSRSTKLEMQYKAGFVLRPGIAGAWDVELAADNVLPVFQNNNSELTIVNESRNNRFGAYQTSGEHDLFTRLFGTKSALDSFTKELATISLSSVKTMESNFKNTIDSMKWAIIMPAGEAFYFDGLDTDEEGNLYTQVQYAVGAEGTSTTGTGITPSGLKT